jgi:hypothetical protein
MTGTQLVFAILALVVPISFGLIVFYRGRRDRNEAKSVERFKLVRNEVRDKRETFRRDAIVRGRLEINGLVVTDEIPLLVAEDWLPPTPTPLEDVRLQFKPDPWAQQIDLPWRKLPISSGIQYKRYSDAISKLDPPKQFEDRRQYRLIEINNGTLSFSSKPYSYFDKINYGEYLMLEFAHNAHNKRRSAFRDRRKSILKRLKGPADYVVLAGISTLTLLHDGTGLRFLMHIRGKTETAFASGTFHVLPAGEFQPACLAPTSFQTDFDLWKNIKREYAEEVLDLAEYDGNSAVPFDYDAEPFMSLENEKAANNIRAFYLGTGLDAITFQGEIMTVIVFKEEVFNRIFGEPREMNREGKIITDRHRWGEPFTKEKVDAYQGKNILATGDAILKIAWKNKDFFMSVF